MKNFLQLLDTELNLTVTVDNHTHQAGLHDHLQFDANSTVTVDHINVLPKYRYLAVDDKLTINEPFYCWYHQVAGHGWLLTPHQG